MIYILDKDPEKCATMLDDKSLDKMIKDLAQVLCNVHHYSGKYHFELPQYLLEPKPVNIEWINWARECKANYLYLVKLGMQCIIETQYRYRTSPVLEMKTLKYADIIHWIRDNVPDLKDCAAITDSCRVKDCRNITGLPLIMPKKYHDKVSMFEEREVSPILSYKNYYRAKLKQKYKNDYENNFDFTKYPVWTNRQKPEWLIL